MAATGTSILLSILKNEESYGYEIIRKVDDITDGQVQYAEGTLYPILNKMEKQGLIVSEKRTMDNGRNRKYYTITDTGRDVLDQHLDQWLIVVGILKKLWGKD